MTEEIHSGLLYKRGKLNKSFKKRWFVLNNDLKLNYYESQTKCLESSKLGSIDILKIQLIKVALIDKTLIPSIPKYIKILTPDNHVENHDNIIHLILQTRTYILSIKTFSSFMTWLNHFHKYVYGNIIFESYGYKKSLINSDLKKTYFVLNQLKQINCYNNNQRQTFDGCIDLNNIYSFNTVSVINYYGENCNAIQLNSAKTLSILCYDTYNLFNDWCQYLTKLGLNDAGKNQCVEILVFGYIKQQLFSNTIRFPDDVIWIIILFCGSRYQDYKVLMQNMEQRIEYSNENDAEFTIVLLGSKVSGIMKLGITLTTGSFEYVIGDIIDYTTILIDGKPCTIRILYGAGYEFSSMEDQWIREGDAFLVIYSITCRTTFDEAIMIRERIFRWKDDEDVPINIILVGAKCDLEDQRQVTKQEGIDLARNWGPNSSFYEVSAKEQINVKQCLYETVARLKCKHVWFEYKPKNSAKNEEKNCIIQ